MAPYDGQCFAFILCDRRNWFLLVPQALSPDLYANPDADLQLTIELFASYQILPGWDRSDRSILLIFLLNYITNTPQNNRAPLFGKLAKSLDPVGEPLELNQS